MRINGTTTPVWQELALNETRVTKFVIPESFIENFKEDAGLPVETSGFLTGIYYRDAFYVLGNNPLCWGKARPIFGIEYRTVGLTPTRDHSWVFMEEITRRFAAIAENVRTVLWHNHCKTTTATLLEMWPDEGQVYLDVLQEELVEGGFDYLGIGGKRPTIDEVVNEVISRKLSLADIEYTPGNTHLLITDTFKESAPLSHLNAFKLISTKSVLGTMPIEVLEQSSPDIIHWHKEVRGLFEAAFHVTCARHETVTETLSDEEQIIPRNSASAFYL